MIKVRIHIESDNNFMDTNVFIEANLPAIPSKGDTLFITGEQRDSLEEQAKKNRDTAVEYFPKWFYGDIDRDADLQDKNIENLSFDDAIIVTNILFRTYDDYVSISIGD